MNAVIRMLSRLIMRKIVRTPPSEMLECLGANWQEQGVADDGLSYALYGHPEYQCRERVRFDDGRIDGAAWAFGDG